jgi:hypothetical protein
LVKIIIPKKVDRIIKREEKHYVGKMIKQSKATGPKVFLWKDK